MVAATLSSKALPWAQTVGYDINSFVPSCPCPLGADAVSLCIPLHSLLYAVECLLLILWISTEDFSVSLPDSGTYSTDIHDKLYGLENPCPGSILSPKNGLGVSGEKVQCPLSVGSIVLYHRCLTLLNTSCCLHQRCLGKGLFSGLCSLIF